MNTKNGWLLTAVLIALLLAMGCSGTATEPQPTATSLPPTETPIPPHTVAIAEDVGIEVIFDESECTFSGPPSVPVGEYQFVLTLRNTDPSDLEYVLNFARILDGSTFQDLLDLQSDPQVFDKRTLNGALAWIPFMMPDFHHNSISFLEEGEYVAAFVHASTRKRVYCGPVTLMVTGTASE